MADVADGETPYWRKHYGIHLISYSTTRNADGSKDHSALLELLDELSRSRATSVGAAATFSQFVLNLARYANGLSRAEKVHPEFPLRVRSITREKALPSYHFDGYAVKRFLTEGPSRSVLVGLPGAGKTYSIRQAVALLSEEVHDGCLVNPPQLNSVTIPLFADLKLYSGNLERLLEENLPVGVRVAALAAEDRLKIFLDSFNEMPREQWDRGVHEADFNSLLEKYPSVELVIGSRTVDGTAKLKLPIYHLEEIDSEFVERELAERRLTFSGRFKNELYTLLQKPFYFRLLSTGAVELPKEPHPRDLYSSFFAKLTTDFTSRFNTKLDLEEALRGAAYEAINRGEEAQPVENILQAIRRELQSAGVAELTPDDVAAWLVSKTVLLPYSGGRTALFHQSITEYLAATELARLYKATPTIIREKVALTRWNQALFLTLSLLPEDLGEAFLDDVLAADFSLAMSAAKYMEKGRDQVVAHLLEFKLAQHLPISKRHDEALRAIWRLRGAIGAAAAARLLELHGDQIKRELLDSLLVERDDYNYCTSVGRSLQSFVTEADVSWAAKAADSIDEEVRGVAEDEAHGFVSGAGELLATTELS